MEFVDSELLINEVEKHRCLYDHNDCDFKHRRSKVEAWTAVARAAAGSHWVQVSNETRNQIGKEVQKRWRSLRDCYARCLRAQQDQKNVPGTVLPKRPYIFEKHLSFLKPFYSRREGSMNTSSTKQESEQVRESESDEPSLPSELKSKRTSLIKTSRWPKKKYTPSDPFEKRVISLLKCNLLQKYEPDRDEMFLKSQVLFMKALSLQDKIDFQLKFLKLVQSFGSKYLSNGHED